MKRIITILLLLPLLANGQTKFSQLPTVSPDANTYFIGLKTVGSTSIDYRFPIGSFFAYLGLLPASDAIPGAVDYRGSTGMITNSTTFIFDSVNGLFMTVPFASTSGIASYWPGTLNQSAFLYNGTAGASTNFGDTVLKFIVLIDGSTRAIESDVENGQSFLFFRQSTHVDSFVLPDKPTGTYTIATTADVSGVNKVQNTDGSITTTGTSTVTASINTAHANTYTAAQTFNNLVLKGSNSITFSPFSGTSSNYNLTFPSSQSTANQTLINDGSGGLTWGSPAIISLHPRLTSQTAAATIGTYTVGASDASFDISANVNVTTSTAHSFSVTCTYTNESNNSVTLTEAFTQITGSTLLTAITNGTGAGSYEGVSFHIRAKAGTSIVWATTGIFTTVTYNAEGLIIQYQ